MLREHRLGSRKKRQQFPRLRSADHPGHAVVAKRLGQLLRRHQHTPGQCRVEDTGIGQFTAPVVMPGHIGTMPIVDNADMP